MRLTKLKPVPLVIAVTGHRDFVDSEIPELPLAAAVREAYSRKKADKELIK